MGVVLFDPAAFKTRYPQFTAVNNTTLQLYFDEATLYLNNTDCSPVKDLAQRAILLNMIVAHLAQLYGGPTGISTGGGAGRVSEATEGTVTVKFDVGTTTMSSAFWYQTPFGIAYWNATARYRTFRYYPRSYRRGCC